MGEVGIASGTSEGDGNGRGHSLWATILCIILYINRNLDSKMPYRQRCARNTAALHQPRLKVSRGRSSLVLDCEEIQSRFILMELEAPMVRASSGNRCAIAQGRRMVAARTDPEA